jgi:hypothetical protein
MPRLTLFASAVLLAACARGPSPSDAAYAAASAQLAAALARSGVQCEPHEPPPVLACDQKSAGAPCQVVDDEGTAQGICKSIPDGRLVCAGVDEDERDGGDAGEDQDQRDGGAHDDRDGGQRHHHDLNRPPPLALVAACVKLAPNAACTATLDERTITGTCRDLLGALVCLPLRPPPPPPIAACAQKSPGASCSLTLNNKTVDGTCRAFGEHGTVACVPAPGPASPPHAAIDACVDHTVNSTCSFIWDEDTFSGSCQKAPDGTILCAPICH